MRIHQDGRLARGVQPVGVKQRMSLGGDDLDILHADAAQFAGHKIGRFLNVGLVFFESADAGNAEKIFEFVHETAADYRGQNQLLGRPWMNTFLARKRNGMTGDDPQNGSV